MKNKITFLKFLIIMLSLNSCSEDLELEDHNHSNYKYSIKKLDYNQAIKNEKFRKVDNMITNKLNLRKRNTSKMGNENKLIFSEDELLFSIDTTLIKEISTENFTSYTMKVILDSISYSDGSFDNLVVQIDNNEKIEAFLIHYKPDSAILYNTIHKTYTFEGTTTVSKTRGITSFFGNGNNGGGLGNNGQDDGTNTDSEGAGGNQTYNSIICVTLILCDYEYTHIAGPGCERTYTRTECYSNPNYNPWAGYGNAPIDETDLNNNNNNNNGPGGGGLGSGNNTNNTQNSSLTTVIVFNEELVDLDLQMRILREKNFKYYLNWNQKTWLNNNPTIEAEIIDYLESQVQNPIEDTEYLNEHISFVEDFIANSIESGLILDFQKSLKSPSNIDFSAIDQSTEEGQQFTWIYSKLMESDKFKEMFTETFQTNDPRINVKFEITNDGIPTNVNGICKLESLNGKYYNTIKIKKSIFGIHSNISIAKTILHECIHAYLNIKKINQNLGTTITELNGLDLGQLLGTFTGGFGGVPVANGTVTSHDFMFNHMIPVFTNVLADLKEKLISQTHISQAEQSSWVLFNNETYNFTWADLFYYLSLNGLHESTLFSNQYPANSINYEKYDRMQELGVLSLTKTIF